MAFRRVVSDSIARAIKRGSRRKGGTSLGKAVRKGIDAHAQMRGQRLPRDKQSSSIVNDGVKLLSDSIGRELAKFAKTRRVNKSLLKQFGILGQVIAWFLQPSGKIPGTKAEQVAAAEVIMAANIRPPGFDIKQHRPGQAPPISPTPIRRFGRNIGPLVTETPRSSSGKAIGGADGLSMFRVESSNVWAFGFILRNERAGRGTMYVQYKAVNLRGHRLGRDHKRKGQIFAERGVTKGKANKAGALYAYFDVPQTTFTNMLFANSAGGAVWDNLRVRHSVFAHQFSYKLISAGFGFLQGGKRINYVPRRATKKGFVKRNITVGNAGRKIGSALPASRFKG